MNFDVDFVSASKFRSMAYNMSWCTYIISGDNTKQFQKQFPVIFEVKSVEILVGNWVVKYSSQNLYI